MLTSVLTVGRKSFHGYFSSMVWKKKSGSRQKVTDYKDLLSCVSDCSYRPESSYHRPMKSFCHFALIASEILGICSNTLKSFLVKPGG